MLVRQWLHRKTQSFYKCGRNRRGADEQKKGASSFYSRSHYLIIQRCLTKYEDVPTALQMRFSSSMSLSRWVNERKRTQTNASPRRHLTDLTATLATLQSPPLRSYYSLWFAAPKNRTKRKSFRKASPGPLANPTREEKGRRQKPLAYGRYGSWRHVNSWLSFLHGQGTVTSWAGQGEARRLAEALCLLVSMWCWCDRKRQKAAQSTSAWREDLVRDVGGRGVVTSKNWEYVTRKRRDIFLLIIRFLSKTTFFPFGRWHWKFEAF